MPCRHTYEFVKEDVEKEGRILLSTEYKNNYTKLKIQCEKGHVYEVRYHRFKYGNRCPICSFDKRRFIYDRIKTYIEKEGWRLLSTDYVNAHQKLKVQCPRGHQHQVSYNNFRKGRRCPKCSGVKKLEYALIKENAEKKGCMLISGEYINSRTKLKIQCSIGHEYEVMYNSFKRGSGCPVCSGVKKLAYKYVKEHIEKRGWALLSTNYKNNCTPLEVQCPREHQYKVTYGNFYMGYGCPFCYRINNYGPNHPSWRGGLSVEPYCYIFSDKEFKDYIKGRDGHVCLNPTCSRKSKRLAIHHIDYNKKNCIQENLITLCISCNSKANIDREWHTHWYRLIMMKRYKFKYEENT